MTRVILTGLIFLFAAAYQPAHALTIKVRAGEHGDYSRIVIPLPKEKRRDVRLAIDKSEKTVRISDLPPAQAFDITELTVTQKAHRVRSASIANTGNGATLLLRLTCDCNIVRYTGISDALIIDIKNSDEAENTETKIVAIESSPIETRHAPTDEDITAPARDLAHQERIRIARERLTSLLAEANAQGEITLKQPESMERPDAPRAQPAITPAFTTSSEESTTNEKIIEACPDSNALNAVSTLGREFAFGDIVRLRRDLQSPDEEIRALAKREIVFAYAGLGLFDEARAIMMSSKQSMDLNFLDALLKLTTGPLAQSANHPPSASFSKIANCDPISTGLNAATAALSEGRGAFDHAALSGLLSLKPVFSGPIHARLAHTALNRGDEAAATAFTAIAESAYGDPQPEIIRFLRVNLEGSGTGPEPTIGSERIVAKTSPVQEAALVSPLQAAVENELPAERSPFGLVQGRLSSVSESVGVHKNHQAALAASSKSGIIGQAFSKIEKGADSSHETVSSAIADKKRMLVKALEDSAEDERIAAALKITDEKITFAEYGDLIDAAAAVAAEYGLLDVISALYDGRSAPLSRDESLAAARAALNANAPASAFAITRPYATDPELALLGLRALNRIDGPQSAQDAEALMSKLGAAGVATTQLAREAFKARDWENATRLYELLPKSALSPQDAEDFLLSALAGGAASPSKYAIDALGDDEETLAVVDSFFRPAFENASKDPILMSAFHNRVNDEIDFMKKRTTP